MDDDLLEVVLVYVLEHRDQVVLMRERHFLGHRAPPQMLIPHLPILVDNLVQPRVPAPFLPLLEPPQPLLLVGSRPFRVHQRDVVAFLLQSRGDGVVRGDEHDGPLVGALADGGDVVVGEIGRAAVGARVQVDDAEDVLVLEGDLAAERRLADARVARDDEAVGLGLWLEVEDAGAGAAGTFKAKAKGGDALEAVGEVVVVGVVAIGGGALEVVAVASTDARGGRTTGKCLGPADAFVLCYLAIAVAVAVAAAVVVQVWFGEAQNAAAASGGRDKSDRHRL